MNKLIYALSFVRSIPAIIVYKSLNQHSKHAIEMDMKVLGSNTDAFSIHKLMISNKIFRKQFLTRVLFESKAKYYLIRLFYKPLFGLDLNAVTGVIGGGLRIYHGYSTIVFCHSMGENCSVYQNVTIGRGKTINGIDIPIIGNDVTIYSGAVVIGGIHIGDHAKIGAGAVVVKDVPEYATVVSQPIRILERGEGHAERE